MDSNQVVFWGHVVFILLAISTGIFLPLGIVILFVIVHRLHVLLFGGCLLSHLHKKLGGLQRERFFLQEFARRVLKKEISERQSKIFDYSLAVSPILIAVIV